MTTRTDLTAHLDDVTYYVTYEHDSWTYDAEYPSGSWASDGGSLPTFPTREAAMAEVEAVAARRAARQAVA